MNREDYFLEPELPVGPNGEEETWARLKDLTVEEAAAIEHALKISGGPYGWGCHESGQYELCLTAESVRRENPGAWLVSCREAEQGEDLIRTPLSDLHAGSQDYNRFHLIVMAKQFADLVRGKLVEKQNDKDERTETTFEVYDEDAGQYVFFNTDGAQSWGPVWSEDNPIDPTWATEHRLYRHGSEGWALLVASHLCEPSAPPGIQHAKRIDSIAAVRWLMDNGFPLPADVAHLQEKLLFVPGPPAPKVVEAGGDIAIKPRWDADRGELSFNGRACKRYRQPAKNQRRLLDAFEECGWPPRIDDPIPPDAKVDRRDRLADTVRALNKGCKLIRFELDGTTEGVIWNADRTTNEASASTDIPF